MIHEQGEREVFLIEFCGLNNIINDRSQGNSTPSFLFESLGDCIAATCRYPLGCRLKPSDTWSFIECLPYGVSFQESLNWHRKLSQEALDDRAALGKLVLHLNFQHVSGQWHKAELLQWNNMSHQLSVRCKSWPIASSSALDKVIVKHPCGNIQGLLGEYPAM